jgi:hypothetical protein
MPQVQPNESRTIDTSVSPFGRRPEGSVLETQLPTNRNAS